MLQNLKTIIKYFLNFCFNSSNVHNKKIGFHTYSLQYLQDFNLNVYVYVYKQIGTRTMSEDIKNV